MLSSGKESSKKGLTSTLECGVFAAKKSCFFFAKKIDFIIFLREVTAANFILEGRCSRNFAFFIKKFVDFETF